MTGTVIERREARAAEPGARPFALARHSLLLAGRSLTKARRNPGMLLDALIMPIMFLLLFVYLFGGAVSGSTQAYLQFIFPGVLVMTMILAGMVSVGLAINVDIKKGVFDRFRSLPIGRSAPLLGLVVSDGPRYVVAGTMLFATGYLMGFRVETNALAALAAAGLATALGFALGWITILIGVAIKEESVVSTVGFLAIFPLSFGTSMAAPAETMPGWLQAWVDVNPVSHAVDACRGLLVGGPVADDAIATLLWSAGFLLVFMPLAVRVYRHRS
ncbi:ABC transporter permease [Actinomadura algeriensis]|uniref:Transport permease protein n=1 Tax=Actinomadura algeriensis TaxID=1679523 RepID=A0ABR9JN37_9ACTN|nr:ABC transporter permease [Actinomadura algeriensis]MBE1531979.1 oleandomycin transport system permease protein [Actinomadura algeriensis]